MVVMKGKRALLEMLVAEKIRYIFGNPGTSEGPILQALEDYPNLEYILTTHETTAMGMADAYARATGNPSFVNLHIETGLANGISLLHNAKKGGTPMVITSANKDIRQLAEGRTDLAEMVRLFTKWSAEATHPEQIPRLIRRAFNEAKTPPTGPVYVGFSANALEGEADMDIVPSKMTFSRVAPDKTALKMASDMLVSASSPVLIVGDRVAQSDAATEAVRLAELLGARVYSTGYSEMDYPTGHPQYLGTINPGLPLGREILSSADVVVAVGTNVFDSLFYVSGNVLQEQTRLIHIDSSSSEIGKTEPTDVGISADPKVALEHLLAILEDKIEGTAREIIRGRVLAIEEERITQKTIWDNHLKQRWDHVPMSSERMMAEVSAVLPKDSIIIDDSVSNRESIFNTIEFNQPGSFFGERGGSLGWGMGAAMGAKLAVQDRPVVAIIGDGSAMMAIQALWTAANSDIPVVYIICNNRSYRILKVNMNTYRTYITNEDKPTKYIATDFPTPLDLAKLAEAMGVYGRTIDNPDDVGPAVEKALNLGKPALLDMVIDGSV